MHIHILNTSIITNGDMFLRKRSFVFKETVFVTAIQDIPLKL